MHQLYIIRCCGLLTWATTFCLCGLADCKPTDSELPVWTQVQAVLQRTDVILHDLSYYSGAATEIRDVCISALLLYCCLCGLVVNHPQCDVCMSGILAWTGFSSQSGWIICLQIISAHV